MPDSSTTPTAPPPAQELGTHAPAASNRSALLIVFLVVFIDLLGFGIVLPQLPRIGDDYVSILISTEKTDSSDGGVSISDGRNNPLGGAIVGMLMASFSLMQFLGAPIWGRISDRVGRRPILLMGLAGSVAFYALFGFACSLPAKDYAGLALGLMFVARIGAGLAGATIATAQAVIADCTPPEKRKHGMALIGAAFGIGFTFGPLTGALAMWQFPSHFEAVGYTASILSLMALAVGFRMLPETRQFGQAPPMDRRWINFSAVRKALANSATGPVVLVFFLATLGFAGFETTLALFLKQVLHLGESNSYLFFAYIGLVLLVTQGLIYRRLAKWVSESTFMLVGILFMALGLIGLAATTWNAEYGAASESAVLAKGSGERLTKTEVESSPDSTVITMVMLALASAVVGFAFLTPSAQALISRRTDANQQGEILGVNQSASALARIVAPLAAITLLKVNPLLPYVFGAGLLLLMLPLMPRIRRG